MKNKIINIFIYIICVAVAGGVLYTSGKKFSNIYINTVTGEVETVVKAVLKSIQKEGMASLKYMEGSAKDSGKALIGSAKASGKALEASAKQSGQDIVSQGTSALVGGLFSGKSVKDITKDGSNILKGQEDKLKGDVKAQEKSLKNELKAQEDKLKEDLKKAFNVAQVEKAIQDAVIVAGLKAVYANQVMVAVIIVSLCCFIATTFLLVKNIVLLLMLAMYGTGKVGVKGTASLFKKKKDE